MPAPIPLQAALKAGALELAAVDAQFLRRSAIGTTAISAADGISGATVAAMPLCNP